MVDTETTSGDRPGAQLQRGQVLRFAVLLEGGLVGLALLAGWWLGYSALATCFPDTAALGWGLAASLPMLALFLLCLLWPVGPLASIQRVTAELIRPLFATSTVLDLAIIATLAGVAEEMFFRGVLQAALGDWLGGAWGLAAASVVFGLLHLVTPAYAVLATLMGAYLGWVWMATGNLLVVMVAHAAYDFVALVVLNRR